MSILRIRAILLGLLVGVLLALTALGIWTAFRVQEDLHDQTANRAANVAVWCNHLVVLEAALVHYVASFHDAPPLGLHQLTPSTCEALEHATTQSTTR